MSRPSRSEFTARTQQLVAYLRDEIKVGSLRLGDYLPSEVELGRTFGLSKESVRRALDVLVDEGWIIKIRRVGNRVQRTVNLMAKDGPSSIRQGIDSSIDAGIVLRLAYYPTLLDEGRLQHAVAVFEQLNPGMRVQLMPTPFPLEYADHGMADVMTLTAWDTLKLKERDPSLARLADAPDTSFAHAKLAQPFQSEQGRQAAAPFVYSPVVLCYNRAHFAACQIEEPGIGWTWYTLLKTARSLHKQLDVRGFIAHIQSVNRWPVFLLQNGFRFHKGEGQRAAEDPALWESLRISRDLIHQQDAYPLWTESDADVERWFRDGRASMILTTFFGLNQLSNTKLDYGVASLPALRSDDSLLLVTGVAINSATPHQDAARLLVRHLCGAEVQLDIRRSTLTMPVHPEALDLQVGLEGNRPSGEAVSAQQWDRYRLYSDLNLTTEVLEAIREELKVYWSKLENEVEASERIEVLFSN